MSRHLVSTASDRRRDEPPGRSRRLASLLPVAMALAGCAELSDRGVAVSASALAEYTEAKFAAELPRPETYVVMAGNYFPGGMVDRSLQKLPFRQLVETLAPQLARRRYLPAKDLASADLILVVHWGVTSPYERMDKLLARDPPSLTRQSGPDANSGVDYHPHTFDASNEESLASDPRVAEAFVGVTRADVMDAAFQQAENRTDALGAEYRRADAVALLGYNRDLRRAATHPFATAEEMTLRSDLETERYFVVIQAYNLHPQNQRKPRLAWTLHLNMRCAGNNFREAVATMGDVAVNYFGRTTDRVDTAMPHERHGTVTVGDITIVGEVR